MEALSNSFEKAIIEILSPRVYFQKTTRVKRDEGEEA